VIELSAQCVEDHRMGAVSAPPTGGRLNGMEDTQHEPRAENHSSSAQIEESRSPEASAVTVGRMLANPRRIRRD
jgi:hypothetical protein